MLKEEFYELVADYADIPIYKAREFVKAFEEEIMMIFATEDSILLKIGRVFGETRESFRYYDNKTGVYRMSKPKPRQPHIHFSKMARERND